MALRPRDILPKKATLAVAILKSLGKKCRLLFLEGRALEVDVRNNKILVLINQVAVPVRLPVQYMTCNARAFQRGDEVLVYAENCDYTKAKVVGFVRTPRPCADVAFTSLVDSPTQRRYSTGLEGVSAVEFSSINLDPNLPDPFGVGLLEEGVFTDLVDGYYRNPTPFVRRRALSGIGGPVDVSFRFSLADPRVVLNQSVVRGSTDNGVYELMVYDPEDDSLLPLITWTGAFGIAYIMFDFGGGELGVVVTEFFYRRVVQWLEPLQISSGYAVVCNIVTWSGSLLDGYSASYETRLVKDGGAEVLLGSGVLYPADSSGVVPDTTFLFTAKINGLTVGLVDSNMGFGYDIDEERYFFSNGESPVGADSGFTASWFFGGWVPNYAVLDNVIIDTMLNYAPRVFSTGIGHLVGIGAYSDSGGGRFFGREVQLVSEAGALITLIQDFGAGSGYILLCGVGSGVDDQGVLVFAAMGVFKLTGWGAHRFFAGIYRLNLTTFALEFMDSATLRYYPQYGYDPATGDEVETSFPTTLDEDLPAVLESPGETYFVTELDIWAPRYNPSGASPRITLSQEYIEMVDEFGDVAVSGTSGVIIRHDGIRFVRDDTTLWENLAANGTETTIGLRDQIRKNAGRRPNPSDIQIRAIDCRTHASIGKRFAVDYTLGNPGEPSVIVQDLDPTFRRNKTAITTGWTHTVASLPRLIPGQTASTDPDGREVELTSLVTLDASVGTGYLIVSGTAAGVDAVTGDARTAVGSTARPRILLQLTADLKTETVTIVPTIVSTGQPVSVTLAVRQEIGGPANDDERMATAILSQVRVKVLNGVTDVSSQFTMAMDADASPSMIFPDKRTSIDQGVPTRLYVVTLTPIDGTATSGLRTVKGRLTYTDINDYDQGVIDEDETDVTDDITIVQRADLRIQATSGIPAVAKRNEVIDLDIDVENLGEASALILGVDSFGVDFFVSGTPVTEHFEYQTAIYTQPLAGAATGTWTVRFTVLETAPDGLVDELDVSLYYVDQVSGITFLAQTGESGHVASPSIRITYRPLFRLTNIADPQGATVNVRAAADGDAFPFSFSISNADPDAAGPNESADLSLTSVLPTVRILRASDFSDVTSFYTIPPDSGLPSTLGNGGGTLISGTIVPKPGAPTGAMVLVLLPEGTYTDTGEAMVATVTAVPTNGSFTAVLVP